MRDAPNIFGAQIEIKSNFKDKAQQKKKIIYKNYFIFFFLFLNFTLMRFKIIKIILYFFP